MPRSREEIEADRLALDEELAALADEAVEVEQEAEEAVEEAVEAAVEVAEEAAEQIEETAAPVAEQVEEIADAAADAAEEAVEETTGVEGEEDVDRVYLRVLERLQQDGHLGPPAVTEAVEQTADVVEPIVEPIAEPIADAIPPRAEHWWFRDRGLPFLPRRGGRRGS